MDTYAAAGIPASVGYELGTHPNPTLILILALTLTLTLTRTRTRTRTRTLTRYDLGTPAYPDPTHDRTVDQLPLTADALVLIATSVQHKVSAGVL
eukprot:scaffold49374_cov33-Phaeocystis_antarctica.AAC.1